MSAPTYWRVTFKRDGAVRGVVRLKGPGHERWVVVQAPTREEAESKAFKIYCARKKRERIARLAAEGRCRCGRPRDAVAATGPNAGKEAAYCTVCLERERAYHQNAKQRPHRTHAQAMAERNEPARVALNLERQRDRRGEIRLETLLECRKAWEAAPSVGKYREWLRAEIDKLTKAKAA